MDLCILKGIRQRVFATIAYHFLDFYWTHKLFKSTNNRDHCHYTENSKIIYKYVHN